MKYISIFLFLALVVWGGSHYLIFNDSIDTSSSALSTVNDEKIDFDRSDSINKDSHSLSIESKLTDEKFYIFDDSLVEEPQIETVKRIDELEDDSFFSYIPQVSKDIELKLKEGVQPQGAVSIAQGSINKLDIGGKLSLKNVLDLDYELLIVDKQKQDGSISVYGEFSKGGVTYSSVLTEGGDVAYATISSPDGVYELELYKGKGYVYLSDDITDSWVRYGESDVTNESIQ